MIASREKTMAADLNKDGVVSALDSVIIKDATIGILSIDRIDGNLLYNSLYIRFSIIIRSRDAYFVRHGIFL